MFLGREPVATLAVIVAALEAGMGFGLDITTAQLGLIMAAATAVIGWIARAQVTPVIDPKVPPDKDMSIGTG